jgi:hypothetical protein
MPQNYNKRETIHRSSLANHPYCQFGAVAELRLVECAMEVNFHGAKGQSEPSRDRLVAQSIGDKRTNLLFSAGES